MKTLLELINNKGVHVKHMPQTNWSWRDLLAPAEGIQLAGKSSRPRRRKEISDIYAHINIIQPASPSWGRQGGRRIAIGREKISQTAAWTKRGKEKGKEKKPDYKSGVIYHARSLAFPFLRNRIVYYAARTEKVERAERKRTALSQSASSLLPNK